VRWIAVALFALSGCDILFQLGDLRTVDASSDGSCAMPDEDGDCIGDDIDNCPGIYNPSQANDSEGATRDAVGDICDPQPTVPAETRVEFWAFDDPEIDAPAWRQEVSNWTFASGYVEHVRVEDLYAFLKRTQPTSEADLTVEVGFTFAAWEATALNAHLGVFIDMPETGSNGQMCVFSTYSSTQGMDSITLQEVVNNNGFSRRQDIPALRPGDELVVSLRRQRAPDRLQCHVLVNGVRYDAPDVAGTMAWPASGHIAISAGSANAKARYLVTYVTH
jgi:hypothetical protein